MARIECFFLYKNKKKGTISSFSLFNGILICYTVRKMKVNVYDFDNTIYDGETLVDYFFFFAKRDKKILKYLPRLLIVALKDKFHLFTVEEAVAAYASFLEGYYVTLEDPAAGIREFWDAHEKKLKPWYDSVKRESDVIVSGTLDFILAEIAARRGYGTCIGSVIDPATGKFLRLNFLENKVKYFRALCPETEIENFYTDSMNDEAMMDISEHVYLVKKDKITKLK